MGLVWSPPRGRSPNQGSENSLSHTSTQIKIKEIIMFLSEHKNQALTSDRMGSNTFPKALILKGARRCSHEYLHFQLFSHA